MGEFMKKTKPIKVIVYYDKDGICKMDAPIRCQCGDLHFHPIFCAKDDVKKILGNELIEFKKAKA